MGPHWCQESYNCLVGIETHVSNKVDATKKHFEVGVYDEKVHIS
jgi:hypothetical protein